jgi:phosphoglycolate phosphatase-like HAD superfamily hydrolase
LLRHIKLLVFDLDYLLFDSSLLKSNALRQSLVSFADTIPHSVRLPDAVDIEDAYRLHGSRWLQGLELGLDESQVEDLAAAYRIHEKRLLEAGVGRVYPGVTELLSACRAAGLRLAVGADSNREYLMSVGDRHGMGDMFDVMLCTEEYGSGMAQEMLEDVMLQAEVHPSETVVLGTRPETFEAARSIDVVPVGCGWGLRRHDELEPAGLRALALRDLPVVLKEIDENAADYAVD